MPSVVTSWSATYNSTTGRAVICLLSVLSVFASCSPFLRAQELRPAPMTDCPECGEAAAPEAASERSQHAVDEITLEPCDRLPMVKLRADGAEKYFLVDTAASSFANLNSFSSVKSRRMRIASWTGSSVTNASEVSIAELAVANHKLLGVKLPAVDLSAIGKSCGHPIDGIFGVELIQQMGLTIDLQHRIGLLRGKTIDAKASYAEMEKQMQECNAAFDLGKTAQLADCFEPDVVLYTPVGEFRGREQAMEYLQKRYLRFAPNVEYRMEVHDIRVFGDALWYTYDYSIVTPEEHPRGHGMAMCRRSDGRWRIVNMHNSVFQTERRP
jgi:uncharacterized protein (TIGR02246 family)